MTYTTHKVEVKYPSGPVTYHLSLPDEMTDMDLKRLLMAIRDLWYEIQDAKK